MRLAFLTVLSIITLAACGPNTEDWPQNTGGKTDSIPAPADGTAVAETEDSKPTAKSIREFGQAIIDGKQNPSDDERTFACLDSLDDKKSEVRKFYFEVYKAIAKQSDGALSEVLGDYLAAYVNSYGDEALLKHEKLSPQDQTLFVDNLAFYFYARQMDPKLFLERALGHCYCETAHDVMAKLLPVLNAKIKQIE